MNSRFYLHVGERICHYRIKRGFTQQDLAERIGMTRASVTNIEAGRQKMLLHTIVLISEILTVNLWRLLP